jgi:hypothetical protein
MARTKCWRLATLLSFAAQSNHTTDNHNKHLTRTSSSQIIILQQTIYHRYLLREILGYESQVAQSAQCVATGWTTGRSSFDPRQRQEIFPVGSVSRPTLGPTQPPVQWVPGILSPGVKRGRGVTLTTHPHLVPKSRMKKNCTSSPLKRLRGV